MIEDYINQIICGDCLEVMKEIPDNLVDLTVTSPPYFNTKKYSHYESINDYMEQMEEIFAIIFLKIKQSRMCIVNISPILIEREKRSKQSYRIPLPFYFVPMMEKIGFEFLEDIIWAKPEGSAKNRNGGFFRHRKPIAYKPNIITEYILVFKKPAPFLIDKVLRNNSLVIGDYEKTNLWRINPDTKSKHPAPFPELLVDKIIRYYSYEGDLVCDPFIGSGTTAVACIKNNRRYIGIEISEEYCEIARRRIKAMPEPLFV